MLGANSPIRLTQLAVAASFGPVVCYVADVLPFFPYLGDLNVAVVTTVLLCYATLFFGGIAISIMAIRKIEKGFASARWNDYEISRASRWITHPAFRYGQFVFLLLYCSIFLLHFAMHFHLGLLAATIVPSLIVSRLNAALKPIPPKRLVSTALAPAPIHSTH